MKNENEKCLFSKSKETEKSHATLFPTHYIIPLFRYGGPGSQLVNDRFRIDWGDYLASEKGIIYTSIDGRGSGYSGDGILHALNRGLGTGEVDDQISVTA